MIEHQFTHECLSQLRGQLNDKRLNSVILEAQCEDAKTDKSLSDSDRDGLTKKLEICRKEAFWLNIQILAIETNIRSPQRKRLQELRIS